MAVKSVWQRKGLARSHAVGRPSLAVWPASGHLHGARQHQGVLRHDAGQLPGDLVEHTARAPQVHFVGVEAIGEETLRGAVPAGGNVLCVRLLGTDAPAGPKVP